MRISDAPRAFVSQTQTQAPTAPAALDRFEKVKPIGGGSLAPDRPYDAIVVGAGVAGLEAARQLIADGKRVLVLEATARIGGRALSDNRRFSVPIDLGAGWLHDPKNNPFVKHVPKDGLALANSMFTERLFVNGRAASREEREAFDRTYGAFEKAIQRAAKKGEDVSAGSFLDPKDRFAKSVGAVYGAFESAREIEKTSTMDVGIFGAGDDYFVKRGIGNLIESWGKDVPVKLKTPVDSVRYDDGGVTVRTKDGAVYRAGTAIVTTSTGVLASGAIQFTPKLPAATTDAIEALPMGLMNKIIFELDDSAAKAFEGMKDNTGALLHEDNGPPIAFVLKPHGKNMAIGFVGGDYAWELEKLPAKEVSALVLGKLSAALGHALTVKSVAVTQWGKNPYTRGAYSAADPGKADARQALAEPVGGRVFFAGEAVSGPEDNGTLRGAYNSGQEVSRKVLAQLMLDAEKTRAATATRARKLPLHPSQFAA